MCIVLDFSNTVVMDLNSTQPMDVSTFLCIVFSCRPYYGCIHHHFRILSKLKIILVKQAMKMWSGLIWLIISAKQLQIITKARNLLMLLLSQLHYRGGPPKKSWVAICHFHYVVYMKSTNDKNWPHDGPDCW